MKPLQTPKATLFAKDKATKEALLLIHSPYILHLATHGFFVSDDANQTEPRPIVEGTPKHPAAQIF